MRDHAQTANIVLAAWRASVAHAPTGARFRKAICRCRCLKYRRLPFSPVPARTSRRRERDEKVDVLAEKLGHLGHTVEGGGAALRMPYERDLAALKRAVRVRVPRPSAVVCTSDEIRAECHTPIGRSLHVRSDQHRVPHAHRP